MDRSGKGTSPQGGLEGLVAVDGVQEQLGVIGCDLVNRLFVLVRNTLLFDLNNEALERPVAALLETLARLADRGELQASIGVLEDNLTLNRQILKPDSATFRNGQFLGRIYRRLQAQAFQLHTAITEPELRAFMAELRQVVNNHEDPSRLSNLSNFKLVPLTGVTAGAENVEIDSRILVLRVYAASIAVVARSMTLAAAGLHWSPNLVRRVAYDLADAADREPNLLLGLLHLPVTQSPLGTHLVRVATLAILCTRKVGLRRRAGTEAAMIALCHHLSRPAEPSLLEPEDLAAGDKAVLGEVDPLDAALALCTRGCLNEDLIRRVVGVYEATSPAQRRRSLYLDATANDLLGRIVSLADRYTVLAETLKPDEALRLLLSERQEDEPDLLRVFVNTVGLYPVGTVVELDSGARAVVVEAPRNKAQLLRPVVQIVEGDGALVDLSQPETGHGQIVRSIGAGELGVNVSHYFLL